jgi:hypothetical protein
LFAWRWHRFQKNPLEMNSDTTLQISFVGDIALNGGYEDLVRKGETGSLVTALRPLLVESDLAIGNLEGPLTSCSSAGPPWRFGLHGNPAYAPILRSAGVNVVSLANNHAMDHGWEGLEETLRHLQSAGINYVGAGMNLNEARKPLHVSVRGVNIAILAYCDVADLSPLYAANDRPGVVPLRRALIFEDIARAKQASDVLILCMHWGQENISAPHPKYRRLGRDMIAAGANIIVGHHPHVLQGIERLDGGVIAYSLGNFTFSDQDWHATMPKGESFSMPYRLSEANRRSAVWKILVDFHGGIIQENLTPVYLGRDLLPRADSRPERKIDSDRNNAALKMRAYGLAWSIRMIGSRFLVNWQQLRGEQGFGKRLARVRPRHIRNLWQLLAREWEQFRGTE